mgnify:CR=1 FL=1
MRDGAGGNVHKSFYASDEVLHMTFWTSTPSAGADRNQFYSKGK